MPIYIDGKKIKTLHYQDRKIKEVWFEGKKVYTSFSLPPQWVEGGAYKAGDLVGAIDARYAPGNVFIFECKPGASYPGYNRPPLYYGNTGSDTNWEFLEKVAVTPFPPAGYETST